MAGKSNLELVAACDSFTYVTQDVEQYYKLYLPLIEAPHGYMLPGIVAKMPWTDDFDINHATREIKLVNRSFSDDLSGVCNKAFQAVIDEIIRQDLFTIVHGQHSELVQIASVIYPVRVERFTLSLFGLVSQGAHMTAYTETADGLKIWVAKRSLKVYTYPGKLDSTVAGGVKAGESPFETIVHESDEEASLPETLIRQRLKSVGVLTYIGVSGDDFVGESGLVDPVILYVYDLKLEPNVVPKPQDDEVEGFYLMSVKEVQEALADSAFKTNSAVVMIDFLIRHGEITMENERDYVEICMRMHRRFPFTVST